MIHKKIKIKIKKKKQAIIRKIIPKKIMTQRKMTKLKKNNSKIILRKQNKNPRRK